MTRRRHNLCNDHGQTMTEYALLLVLMVAVVMAVLPLFGPSVLHLFTSFTSAFEGATA
jgi:Flp pilus assembly pilin Flp